ncbi:ABC transporter permease [Bacillus bombysepticus]|uniref:ABC transporter permease n=1 Tax=Bacillus bombysepticus TaxID=658666 RepID=UPI0020793698|nr:ABC transporter permease [Bacillus bombysepticus]USL11079.1 ABC transporter permease [Bacillus bombysepticus]
MRVIWSIIKKDTRLMLREPFYIGISIILPIMFYIFFTIITSGSATVPIAIVDDAQNANSREFIALFSEKIDNKRDLEASYWEIVSTNTKESMSLFSNREVMSMVIIPENFDKNSKVIMKTHNINSDYTKNFQLRLDEIINYYNHNKLDFNNQISVKEKSWVQKDIPMLTYMASSLLVFAFLYGGMVNTGVLIAREWEEDTVKELLLSPVSKIHLVIGKMLSGLVPTFISGGIIYLIIYLVQGFKPTGNLLLILLLVLITAFLGVGIGVLIGSLTKRILPTIQINIIIAVVSLIIGGGFSPLDGLAWGGVSQYVYYFSKILPPYYAFKAGHLIMNTEFLDNFFLYLIIVLGSSLIIISLASLYLSKGLKQAPRPKVY